MFRKSFRTMARGGLKKFAGAILLIAGLILVFRSLPDWFWVLGIAIVLLVLGWTLLNSET